MKTVTVIAYNRPDYLRRVLKALSECRGIENYNTVVSLDGSWLSPSPEQYLCANVAFEYAPCPRRVRRAGRLMGVNNHPLEVYGGVFGNIELSDFNVCLEDDIVPSPDALELADWFYTHPSRDNYACLLLHSGSRDQSSPLQLNEVSRFVPWGWAMTRNAWLNTFRPEWNNKKNHPNGWDWSVGLTIQRCGLKVLKPVLSRTLNIGRNGGTYETPAHWDEWAKDLVMSDGTHGQEYFIGDRLQPGYESDVDQWVKEAVV